MGGLLSMLEGWVAVALAAAFVKVDDLAGAGRWFADEVAGGGFPCEEAIGDGEVYQAFDGESLEFELGMQFFD
jgi:hypothetical protein